MQTSLLYALWRRLGVMFTDAPSTTPVDLEALITTTAVALRTDGRLGVGAASWLARHHDWVDGRRLSELTRDLPVEQSAYMGVLLSLAIESPRHGAGSAPQFEAALSHCSPARRASPLFAVPQQFAKVQRAWMRRHALPLFSRWGFWHDDAGLKPESLRPLDRILREVPELRIRALMGPSLESACLAAAATARPTATPTNARQLSRELGATYAATHAAVQRLVGRGLLLRERDGVRQTLRLSDFARAALSLDA